MANRERANLYLADRQKGMSLRAIAAKYGVSHQAVSQVCAKYMPGRFVPFTPEQVIYPNLRRWLNENRVSKSEFLRRMGNLPQASSSESLRSWFRGDHYPDKAHIDKILAVTGLTYEELWEVEE